MALLSRYVYFAWDFSFLLLTNSPVKQEENEVLNCFIRLESLFGVERRCKIGHHAFRWDGGYFLRFFFVFVTGFIS